MSDLKHLREKLDTVDEEIIRSIARRMDIVREIAQEKSSKPDGIKDPAREQEIIKRIEAIARELDVPAPFMKKLFRDIINQSVSEQAKSFGKDPHAKPGKPITVVFQGVENSYSHLALQHYFSGDNRRVESAGCRTFREAIFRLTEGSADYALLPLENTTAGSINEVYNLLLASHLFIVGEEIWKVEHCLIGCEDAPLEKIERILSHPQAIDQCGNFLATLPNAMVEGFFDTAGAVEKVAADGNPRQAAIASLEAAEARDLFVLKRNIANQEENYTRFVVLSREQIHYDVRIPCKTSMVLSTRHEKGALTSCLDVLSEHDLNMTKLESRPRPNHPWEYLFYIDFEGNIADPRVEAAVEKLKAASLYLKVLGSYPAKALAKGAALSIPAETQAPAALPPKAAEEKAPAAIKSKHYKLVSRDSRAEDTHIRVGDLLIGSGGFVVMAGPCAVESREQIMQTARHVKARGAHILRGGVFKPRTSPYSFQGLEWEGLQLLSEAGKEYGLPIVTEVLAPEHARKIAEKSDILQIGARNMQNFPLLREVGKIDRPVLLKRGLMSTLEELLAAAEYIVAQGNGQVILCERGIRTFETATRNTLDLSALPVLAERTHLPVVIDPSHGTGKRAYVAPMALAARAAGAHGLIIEVHPDPDSALSDGDQSITFDQFSDLMGRLNALKL